MVNLSTLDTVIAVVIVLLVLSLVVQSVQQGLKKLLKIKSRQIEDSLVDLFEHVLGATTHQPESWFGRVVHNSPILRLVFRRPHPATYNKEVGRLFSGVMDKFKELGRASQSGKVMLDSIAWEDLLKVLAEVAPTVLTPDFATRLRRAYDEFQALERTITAFDLSKVSAFLSEDAKNKFAKLQGALRPLLNDIYAYDLSAYLRPPAAEAEEKPASATSLIPTPTTIISDLTKLRQVRLRDLRQLLAEAEKQVEQELALAKLNPNGTTAAAALTGAADGLRAVAVGLTGLNQKIDQVLDNLTRAETWYDTVMQSFEERYTRSMKTWGLTISFVVVMLLNANFFSIYHNIATSDVLRENVLQANEAVVKQFADRAAAGQPAPETVQAWYKETKNQITSDASLYTGLGFTPLTWENISDWFTRSGGWRYKTRGEWLRQPVYSLFGWLIMTLLLSVGAPFWQDMLESLFSLKNVLRQKSGAKNVEGQIGGSS
jgi:hypothetical protein